MYVQTSVQVSIDASKMQTRETKFNKSNVSSDRGNGYRPYQKLGGPQSWVANIATAA